LIAEVIKGKVINTRATPGNQLVPYKAKTSRVSAGGIYTEPLNNKPLFPLPVMLSPANAWNSTMAFFMASAARIVPELGLRTWGLKYPNWER
jgi:hypothetical protein